MEENNTKTIQEEYINSKCPNCGSELKFLPGTKKIKCISCDSEFDIQSLGTGKLDDEEVNYLDTLKKIQNAAITHQKQRTIHCQDCGGLILLNERTVSVQCPFCGSNRVVVEDKENEIIKINGIVPFLLNENDVKKQFHLWIKKKFFAPKKFKKGQLHPSYSAFYIPFYTFDAKTDSNYTGYRGDYYYTTRTVHTKNGTKVVSERHTRWNYRTGRIQIHFDDILINGTNNYLNQYVSKIASYDFAKMEKFQEKFLLGYYTEKPSISLEQGFESAKTTMMENIKIACIKDIGGDTYSNLNFKTNFSDVTFKQIMAPIYNGHYTYKNKKYNFLCNGQNGKFVGNYPISTAKIIVIVFLSLLVVALVFLLFYFLFQDSNDDYFAIFNFLLMMR